MKFADKENVVINVAVGVFYEDTIMLLHTAKNDVHHIPGDSVHQDESIIDAAKRIALEQAGITVSNLKMADVTDYVYEGTRYLIFVYATAVFDGVLTDTGMGKPVWLDITDIRDMCVIEPCFDDILPYEGILKEHPVKRTPCNAKWEDAFSRWQSVVIDDIVSNNLA